MEVSIAPGAMPNCPCRFRWDESIPKPWRRAAVLSITFWVAAAIACPMFALKFVKATNMNLNPPPNTDSKRADDALTKYFPKMQQQSQIAMLIETKDGCNMRVANSSCLAEVSAFEQQANKTVMEYSKHPVKPSVLGCCMFNASTMGIPPQIPPVVVQAAINVAGWFLDSELMSADGTATILMVILADPHADTSGVTDINSFIDFMRNDVMHASWSLPSDRFSIRLTGLDVMNLEMVEGAIEDMEHMDSATIPLAFVVLAYFLRSIRLMIIPGCTILCAMCLSFALCYPFTFIMDFMTPCPSVIMSTCLAFCIDYNLFLLMRFLEGVQTRLSLRDNVAGMLKYTAVHCIGVSGSLITLAYLGLLFIPVEPLQAIGVAGACAMVAVVVVNITLTPAIILCFGNWFQVSAAKDVRRCRARCCGGGVREPKVDDGDETDTDWESETPPEEQPNPNITHLQDDQVKPLLKPVWHRIAAKRTSATAGFDKMSPSGRPGDLDIRDIYDAFDRDGDGFVSAREVCEVMRAAGEPLKYADVELMFDALGEIAQNEEDGLPRRIDYNDFCRLLRLLKDAKEDVLVARQKKSIWYRMTDSMSKYPLLVIVIVIAAGTPFWLRVPDVKTSMDQLQFLPRNAPAVLAFQDIQQKFLPGEVEPFYIVLENTSDFPAPPPGVAHLNNVSGVFGPEAFGLMNEICSLVQNSTSLGTNAYEVAWNNSYHHFNDSAHFWLKPRQQYSYKYFQGPVWLPIPEPIGSINIKWWEVSLFLNLTRHNTTKGNISAVENALDDVVRQVYAAVLGMQMTPDHRAALITVSPPFNSMSHEASLWIKRVREILHSYENRKDVKLYLGGAGQSAGLVLYDYNEKVDKVMPTMLSILFGVVFVIVAAIFRSVFIPLRLIISVVYTVAVTFGVAWYVFQTTSFEWLFTAQRMFRGDALCWFIPPLCISITMGLALDYDIFLLARIAEFREYGYTDRAAVLKGVYKSGGIISGAGVIMSIAFGGLLMSKMQALNQFGVILVVSVLLSTFVIRTLFTPPFMFLLGRLNWWPRSLPPPTLTEYDFKEEVEHLTALDLVEDGASSASEHLSQAGSPYRSRAASAARPPKVLSSSADTTPPGRSGAKSPDAPNTLTLSP